MLAAWCARRSAAAPAGQLHAWSQVRTSQRSLGTTLLASEATQASGQLVAGSVILEAMAMKASARRVLLCAVLLNSQLRTAAAVRYGFTGRPQEYIVPAGTTSIKVVAVGARGGPGSSAGMYALYPSSELVV